MNVEGYMWQGRVSFGWASAGEEAAPAWGGDEEEAALVRGGFGLGR